MEFALRFRRTSAIRTCALQSDIAKIELRLISSLSILLTS